MDLIDVVTGDKPLIIKHEIDAASMAKLFGTLLLLMIIQRLLK